jgi:hypothetical protein
MLKKIIKKILEKFKKKEKVKMDEITKMKIKLLILKQKQPD